MKGINGIKKKRKKIMVAAILIVMILGYVIDPFRIFATEDINSTGNINLESNVIDEHQVDENDIVPLEETVNIEGVLQQKENLVEASNKADITVNTKNDTHEIRTFSAQFVSGAEKEKNGNLVWTPLNSSEGHEFTFRVNYAISGLKELPKGAIQITIPKSIIRDRNEKLDDHYIMSLPTSEEYDGTTELAYIEEEDSIVVYNPDEVEAGMNGYFEVSYATNSETFNYKDYDTEKTDLVKNGGTASDLFNAVITVKSGNDTLANVSDDINVFINTNAKILSTQKRYPNIYREWNSSWMKDKPANSDEYYYLVWELCTNVESPTQGYNFSIEDFVTDLTEGTNGKDYELVGYKLSGEKYYSNKNTQENITREGIRYDYVLTRHKKSTYSGIKYTLKNTETAIVDPIDQVDEDTKATSSNQFSWDPGFEPPTGHFNLFKYGNNNWHYKFGEYWDYANYDLEKLQKQEVNELKGFKYFTETIGYSYPWTLKEGGSSDNPADYGVNPVSFDTWDDTLYLEGDTQPIKYEDYYLEHIEYKITNTDAVFDEFYNKFKETTVKYENNETITFYGKFNGKKDWIQIGTYNLSTKKLTPNNEYVSEMTTSKIIFKEGVHCTGWRFTTANKHYYTYITVTPYFVLTNSQYVMEKIKDKDSIKIQNNVSTNIKDYKDKTIFEKETYAIDYARVTYYDSEITKKVTAVSNEVLKRLYVITWKVNAWETATSGSGEAEYIRQNSGVFWDLIPLGGEIDVNSIQVQNENGFLPENEYTYETIANYKNSGRTMLIVRIKEQAQHYTVFYNTVHSWESMADYGRNVLNPVAYETGNEKITNGFADDGGTLSGVNKELYNDIDSATDDKKFIYAEQTNDINAITAAVSGLYKKVKNSTESAYSYETETEPNGIYSYQMRYQNNYINKSKNLIFFDSLENFVIRDSEAGTEKTSGWKGTLKYIDLTQIKNCGIDPVVYISTKENLDLEENHNLSDKSTWTKVTENTDLSKAKAVAIDMRKDISGNDFILDTGKAVTAVLYMEAPNNIIDESNPYTYNNIYMNNTLIDERGGTEDYFIHQDYTKVKYHVVADVEFIKVNEKNEEEKIKGITFRLYGTSNYGTEIDLYITSDKDGNVKFKNVEAGTYVLQEYEATPDWLEDHTEHTVEITNTREVKIDGKLTTKDDPVKIKNKQRIHTDVTFTKRNLVTKLKITGSKFKLTGTSKYGNEILKYAISDETGEVTFEDLEYGTYSLKEIEAAENYILNEEDEYKVVVDENGNYDILKVEAEKTVSTYEKGSYNIYNEPLHNFRIVKKDSYSDKTIEGVKFRLFGTSDYGNTYNEEVESTSIGFVDFENLESGTYVLQETVVPEITEGNNKITYVLDENKYTVTVEKNGNVIIDGKEKNENGNFIFYNERNKGQITITKKWLDDKENSERPEPTVIISTQKPLESRIVYFRDNYDQNNGPLYYIDSNYKTKITGSFARNTTLTEEEVIRLGAQRLDREYDNPNAGKKIYGWIDNNGNFWWWSNAEVALMTDNSNRMFSYMNNVKYIDTTDINTSNVTNMSSMFSSCSNITEIDLSNLDTSNVTDMSKMFLYCRRLVELNLSTFNTGNVTDMTWMFMECNALTNLDVSKFDTSKVTDMPYMFAYCKSIQVLDISSFDTSSITDADEIQRMFTYMDMLETIYASDKFNVQHVEPSGRTIFTACPNLVGGNGTDTEDGRTFYSDYARIDKPGEPGFFTEKVASTASIDDNKTVEIEEIKLQDTKIMNSNTEGEEVVLTYSSADEHYDDNGNKIAWAKDGDTWTYTFYVDDPHADWYVWEDPVPNGYETNYTRFEPGEVKVQNATITNYIPSKESLTEYGNLKITKKLFSIQNNIETELTTKEDNREFTFTVTLTASEGKEDKISGTKIFGNYIFKDGVGTIKLHAGESALITDLPAGTSYEITEKQLTGYTGFKENRGTITKNKTEEVIANNYKEVSEGGTTAESEKTVNIILAKKVTGNSEKEDNYTFEIALDNLKPEKTYYLSNEESFVSNRNGSANVTVTLKNNESIVIKDIPVGSKYKVYEGAGKYTSSYVIIDSSNKGLINNSADNNTKENTALSTATETADEGENVTIIFINNKTVTQNLKLAKTVTDENDKNVYIFTIEFANMEKNSSFNSSVGKVIADSKGKAGITVYLSGGDEAEFYNVPVGTTYKVTELASSSIAAYNITDQNAINKIVSKSGANDTARTALSTEVETVNEGEEAIITFINDTVNQEPDSVSVTVGVEKEVLRMDGTKFEDCEDIFTFEFKAENENNPMPINTSITVTGNGNASFGQITFDKTGTYEYTITEKKGTIEYYNYDETVYSIVYEVTNTEGLLEITKFVKKNGFDGDAIIFTNKIAKIDVKVLKKDDDRNAVLGAILQILDSDKNIVDEWETDGEEHVTKLTKGEYTLHEVKAPEGYEIAKDIKFIVTKEGKVEVDDKEVEKVIMLDSKIKEKPAEPERPAEPEKPAEPERPEEPDDKKEEPKVPENNKVEEPNKIIEAVTTGDAMISAIIALAVASMVLVIVLVIINRETKEC